jgi:myo-inositol-1(or 4)-monophosphatase
MDQSARSQELQTAIAAARLAGDAIRRLEVASLIKHEKIVDRQKMGLVTQADLVAEQVILEQIESTFPDHLILSEETRHSIEIGNNLWVIDPLDGTNNFAHGIPHYSVSIAFCRNGQPECGVVLNAATGDLYFAQRGAGAWRGERAIRVNAEPALDQTIVGTGFYYDRGAMMRSTLRSIQELFERGLQGIRRFGSAALDLTCVASGQFGGYFEYQLSPWDFAAGKLIVEEAGGKVTDCFGNELGLSTTTLLASNALLHDLLLETTRQGARF